MSERYIIPIFVPHLGCPNECTFCNQRTISGQMKHITIEEVKEQIEKFLKSFKNDDIEKDIARAKESMNDDIRLSRLLKQQTSNVPDNDWNTALGQIVQNLINENSLEDLDYIYEDLETLENQKAELDKLIMLTGENGRVIWSIS